MGTVIMLFILPLGVLVYFWDRRNYAQSLTIFLNYITQMSHTDLPDADKIAKIDEMFYQNGYTRIERSDTHLIIEKKTFQHRDAFNLGGIADLFWAVFLSALLPVFSQTAQVEH